jgi:kynurenine formamidase
MKDTVTTAGHATTGTAERWTYQLIDLSRPLSEETAHALLGDLLSSELMADAPDLSKVTLDYVIDWSTSNGATCYIALSDHFGTHMDAPYHCWEPGVSLEKVDIGKLFGEAVVLDLHKGHVDYGYTADDLEAAGTDVMAGDIVLIYSGYVDAKRGERMRQTYLTPGAAQWLVERGVHAVGCEPAGIEHVWDGYYVKRWYDKDTPNKPSWPAHQILLSNDVYVIEGLTNLERIKGQRVRFAALPLAIPQATGCPVRAVAWLER